MSSILTVTQARALHCIAANTSLQQHFYLAGGTALSEYYLHHRYSEDLDFFSEHEVDPLTITSFLKSKQKELGFKTFEYEQSFNRNLYFLRYPEEELKMEFTYFPFTQIEKPTIIDGLKIDSLTDIAVNKLFTIYQRSVARDYIDLYLLCKTKGFSIEPLIKQARIKFDWHIDPLQLGTQFRKALEVADLPRMIVELPDDEWRDFFLRESKKFKPDVLSESDKGGSD